MNYNGDLQCTVRNKLLLSFPHGELASHLYSPASFLLMLVSSRMFPCDRLQVVTAIHDTDGTGRPSTLQVSVLFAPSITVKLFSSCMADFIIKRNTQTNYWQSFFITTSSFLTTVNFVLTLFRGQIKIHMKRYNQ